jgi:DNA-binding MarR family transcriptional regulator
MSPRDVVLEFAARLFKVNRIMLECTQRLLEEEGLVDLQPTTVAVLLPLLSKDGLTLSELARGLHMKAPTVTVIANRLEERGWIKRKRSTEDRRQVHLFLTEAGRENAEVFSRIRRRLNRQMGSGLSKSSIAAASQVLARMYSNLEATLD